MSLNPIPTKTPWHYVVDPRGRLVHVETTDGYPVCSIPTKRVADAAFIVNACNTYNDAAALRRRLAELVER